VGSAAARRPKPPTRSGGERGSGALRGLRFVTGAIVRRSPPGRIRGGGAVRRCFQVSLAANQALGSGRGRPSRRFRGEVFAIRFDGPGELAASRLLRFDLHDKDLTTRTCRSRLTQGTLSSRREATIVAKRRRSMMRRCSIAAALAFHRTGDSLQRALGLCADFGIMLSKRPLSEHVVLW